MKSMTCRQLGGVCEQIFTAATFEEMSALSQSHGREMFEAKDGPHMEAMSKMMEIMKSGQMETWMSDRRSEFDAL